MRHQQIVSRLGVFSLFLLLVIFSGCSQPDNDSPATAATPAGAVQPQTAAIAQPSELPQADAAVYQGVPVQVADISDDSFDDGNAVAVTFSVPLDGSRDFQRYLSVQKKQADGSWAMTAGGWILSPDGSTVFFDQVEPDSSYRVSVEPGIMAVNGDSLHQPASADVSFGALQASVSFATNGHFLPLNLHTGLPVYALNTAEANVSFMRIDADRLASFFSWKNNGLSENYYRLDELPAFAELVYEGRFSLTAERNKRRLLNLPVQNIEALHQPGVYVALMTRPGAYDNPLAVTYFMVTDIGMQVRSYGNHFDVYLNRLAQPAPVADAEVQLLNRNGSVAFTGRSSPQGWLRVQRQPAWGQILVARQGESVSVVSMDTPALDLSDFELAQRPYQATELFVYAPRDIYRGGETAVFSALLRDHDGQSVNSRPLKARIIRPDGQKVKDISWQPQAAGYYQYDYPLAEDAQTGDWRFEVEGVSKNRVVYRFKVEDFMPERLKLTFNPGRTEPLFLRPAEALSIPLLGEYLYGAPASANRFDASIRVSQLAHPFEQYADYFFGNSRDDSNNQQFVRNGAQLDKDGRYQLTVDSRWSAARTPLAVTITGSLFESGGRPVVRRYTARVLPAQRLTGIRPLFGDYAEANSQAEFELINTDENGRLGTVSGARIRLINMNRRYHWRYDSARGWYVETTEREYQALTLTQDIRADGSTRIGLPVKYGLYRIEVEDPHNGLISSMTFKAGQSWYWDWQESANSEQGARPDKVTLALDKGAYDAGDVAQLKIVPPAAGESLVLVESDQLLWSSRLHVPAEGASVDIPLADDWTRHDIHISVLHLQPADNQERITPTRSIGLLHLPLNREPRRLQVSTDAPVKWQPDQKVVTTVKVSDAGGQPLERAWLTLAAVDVGVLSLTDFSTPDAFDWFFSPRRYLVDMRDMYSRLIGLNDNRLATVKFGGDADALSRGGKQARSEVQIVSLFSGLVEVHNGEARIPLTLPDFNGRLRLMAVAFDGSRYGNLEQDVTLAAPLVTQLSMPRFVAVGDETLVALDVTNLSGETQPLTLQFHVDGALTVLDPASQQAQFTLADGEKKTFFLPLRAGYPAGPMEIGMTLTGAGDFSLQRHWQLNSRAANPALTHKKDALLKPGEQLTLSRAELKDLLPASLEAVLAVNTQVNLDPRSQLRSLLHYPYGCLEQSVSASWPWIYATDQQLSRLGLENNTGRQRDEALNTGLERIIKRQMSNGGFGLWSNHDDDEQHWLTAYAADFLTDAQDQGVRVDRDLLSRTLQRLSDYVRSRATFRERWSGRPEMYRQSYQAYAAYVLARHKKAPLTEVRRLAAGLLADSPALPVLHLALAAQLQGDQALAQQLLVKLQQTQRTRDLYIGDYGSDIRDTAQLVRLLLRYQLNESYAYEQALTLATKLRQRHYLSTQERNSVFMAAVELDNQAGKEWQGLLTVGSDDEPLMQTGLYSRLLSGASLAQGLTLTNQSRERLYVSLAYQGHSELPPPPLSEGLSVERRYFTTAGEPVMPVDGALTMAVGDLMLVQVRVRPKDNDRRPDLMLVDLLPAGLELENQNLNASVKLDELVIDGSPLSHWQQESRILHQEYRDDRFVAAFDSAYYDATNIFYLVRAVTPGNYQVPAPLVEDMYDPEIRAVGLTPDILTVTQP